MRVSYYPVRKILACHASASPSKWVCLLVSQFVLGVGFSASCTRREKQNTKHENKNQRGKDSLGLGPRLWSHSACLPCSSGTELPQSRSRAACRDLRVVFRPLIVFDTSPINGSLLSSYGGWNPSISTQAPANPNAWAQTDRQASPGMSGAAKNVLNSSPIFLKSWSCRPSRFESLELTKALLKKLRQALRTANSLRISLRCTDCPVLAELLTTATILPTSSSRAPVVAFNFWAAKKFSSEDLLHLAHLGRVMTQGKIAVLVHILFIYVCTLRLCTWGGELAKMQTGHC